MAVVYQLQLHKILDDGTDIFMYPINTALDVKVGKLSTGSLSLPGSASDEILAQTLANIKKYLANLSTVAAENRGVSSSTTSSSEIDLATSKAVNDLKTRIDGNDELLAGHTTEIAGKAPINHATNDLKYGGATGGNYGHVKLSDTYATAVANGSAQYSVGASQAALFNAYNALNNAKAPNDHAVAATTYGIGTASLYGHVKLSDTYASIISNGAAANGLAASQNALYNAYAALKGVNDTQTTQINGKAPTVHSSDAAATYGASTGSKFGHVKLSDSFNADNSATGAAANSIAASSWAVYRAYSTLSVAVGTKLAATHADEKATASKFSHVKLTDTYTASGGAASAGVAPSSAALYNAYAALLGKITSAESSISTLNSRTGMFNDSGLLVGNISTNDGASFATDGNVYLKSNGYSDWLTNILNSKISTNASCNKNWNWAGQGGQPTWVWGGEDGTNMYVYNPANFSVSYATSSGTSQITSQLAAGYPGGIVQASWDGTTANFGIWNVPSGTYNCGFSQARWKTVFAASGSINTSDRRHKKDIYRIDDRYEEFFMKLIPVSYLFKDGESGRTHIGFISQDVEAAMKECGMTDLDFAGFCKDLDFIPTEDSNGNRKNIQKYDENGKPEYLYSLRYDEFIALNTHMIQKLYAKVAELEKSIQ